MILDVKGNPISECEIEDSCPRCGKAITCSLIHRGFGGYWTQSCPCGFQFAKGRGDVPNRGRVQE